MRTPGTNSAHATRRSSARYKRAFVAAFVGSLVMAGGVALAQPVRYGTYLGTFAGAAFVAAGADGSTYVTYGEETPRGLRVTKLDRARHVVWSISIGGEPGIYEAYAIAATPDGGVWVSGVTSTSSFPLVSPWQPSGYAINAGFLLRLSPQGALTFSTLFAQSGIAAHKIVADADSSVVITGIACVPGLPITAGVVQPVRAGGCDAFVGRVTPDGLPAALTYLGGTAGEFGHALAFGPGGDIYVTGITSSQDFPVSPGAYQSTQGRVGCHFYDDDDCFHGFAARLSRDLTQLRFATYVRGTDTTLKTFEYPRGIGVDASGDAYLVGWTSSGNLFPTTAGSYRPTCTPCSGNENFLLHLNAQGTAAVSSTFLDPETFSRALHVDAAGRATIAALTQNSFAIVQRFDAAATSVQFAATIPGVYDVADMAIGINGTAWIGGVTRSSGLPVTPDALQPTFLGLSDAFLVAVGGVPDAKLAIGVPTGTVIGPFGVGGWAIDAGSDAGAGVDTVHVWAYPNPGSGAAPIFIGAAPVDVPRPDVAALFGPQFANSGWNMAAPSLAPGPYLLAVFGHSVLTGTFDVLQTRAITAVAQPILTIDTPAERATSPSPLFIGGWAIDRGAGVGTGVDTVHVWAYPNPGSGAAPVFLGVATYGVPRNDVGAVYGSQFAPSGYVLQPAMAPGTYLIVVFAHSTVTNSFAAMQTRVVTIQ